MLNVAILSGGDSGEYEISVKSGKQVEKHLDRRKFKPFIVLVRGSSWSCFYDGEEFPVDKNDFSLDLPGRKIRFDVVFNAIHGTPGEDGKMLGYFDLLGIPYTSCDVTTSALTFNKSFCKKVVASYDVRTARSLHLFRSTKDPLSRVWENLSLPVFVKPNNGGSSVGMSKVNTPDELESAITKAFHEDNEILIEEFISGRELTCGVLRTKGKIVALPVTEIISKKEFFDYEAKYQDGLAREVVPAEISDELSKDCQSVSTMLYEKLNCKGVVRFDYILHRNQFHFLEVNTVPGLSEQSIVPKMARARGWTMKELFTKMIEEAIK